MNTIILIPSKSRLKIKTLEILKKSKYPVKIVVPESQVSMYGEKHNPENIVGCPLNGIGTTRWWCKEHYFNDYEFILMIDDDIEELIRVIDKKDTIVDINELIDEMKTVLTERDAYFGGITLCANRFYTKERVSNNLKYIAGAMQIYRKKENADIIKCDYRHFEDYVYNILYFIRDGIICRWDNVIPKTKNYNPDGGICEDYGSLTIRLQDAEEKAETITERFPGLVKKYYKKKSARGPACVNLRLNGYYKKI